MIINWKLLMKPSNTFLKISMNFKKKLKLLMKSQMKSLKKIQNVKQINYHKINRLKIT